MKRQKNIVKSIDDWGHFQLELNNMLIRENVINNKMKKVESLKVLRTERIFKEQYMKI